MRGGKIKKIHQFVKYISQEIIETLENKSMAIEVDLIHGQNNTVNSNLGKRRNILGNFLH